MVTVAEILASQWGDNARRLLSMGVSESQVIALFGPHLDAQSASLVVGGFPEGEFLRTYTASGGVVSEDTDPEGEEDADEETATILPVPRVVPEPKGSLPGYRGVEIGMAIVSLTLTVVRQAAPWIITKVIALGLKALLIAEVMEIVTGKEFYSLDDVLQYVVYALRGGGQPSPFVPGVVGVNHMDYPQNNQVGAVRQGWIIKDTETWSYGRKGSKKVWYKPYKDPSKSRTGQVMNFAERAAYFQGKRVQAHDSRRFKYAAYKRGKKHGADEEDTKDITNKEVLMALAARQ